MKKILSSLLMLGVLCGFSLATIGCGGGAKKADTPKKEEAKKEEAKKT